MSSLRSLCWSYLYALLLISFLITAILPTAAFAGPVVQITQPQQGETVTGVIWIDVSYSTNTDAPIIRLEIYIDGQLAKPFDLAAPEKAGRKSFSWDFSFAAATAHSISAKAIDSAGASGSANITVTVRKAETAAPQPGARDVVPPTINIYYPAQGAKLRDMVEIKAEARDNVGVQQVYFYIDGKLHKMMYNNSPPYYDQWDTRKVADGTHVLEASAFDAAENEARSAQVTVFVENHSMTRMETQATTSTVETATATPPQPVTPQPVTPQPAVVPAPTPAPVVTPPTPAPTEVVSTPPAVVTPQPQRVAPGAVTEPTQVRGAVAPPAMPPLRSQAFAAAPLTTRPEHYLALIPPAVAETPASYAAGSSAPPVLTTSETEIAANPRTTTPMLPIFAREQVVEQPTLAGASLVKLGGQHGPIGRYAATDMDYTISPRSTYSGHILRAPDAIAEPPVTSLEATQPVEIKRPVPHYGGLAVVRKPAPAADTTAPTPIVPTEIRTTAPQRETTGATTAKAVAPETQVTVQRPVIPPTLAATQSAPVAPQSATAIERDRQLTATYAAAAKTTPPEYVAPQPVTGPATPVTLPNRTSTAVAQADAALTTAGQHTSMPQYIQPLPTAARSAAEADATIPTFAMLTKVMPGSGLVSAQSPQRTSAPQKISLAPMTPRPEPAAPKVTELPALAAGNAVPVKTDHSKLVMLPRTEAPRLSDTGCTTTPGQPELAAAIAKSPVKDISIVYNGKTLDLRAAPETANGIATGPLRELFEQSDGLLYWFPITKEVRAIGPETNLHLTIGNPEVDLNGTRQQVPVAPYIKQGRTMLPLQFIADTLELTITYEPDTQQIVITTSEF